MNRGITTSELLSFYRSQGQRLKLQLRKLQSEMKLEALRINTQLLFKPATTQMLRNHGIPDHIIAMTSRRAVPEGILFEFPGGFMARNKKIVRHRPFNKPTRAEKTAAGVFIERDILIAAKAKNTLDNK